MIITTLKQSDLFHTFGVSQFFCLHSISSLEKYTHNTEKIQIFTLDLIFFSPYKIVLETLLKIYQYWIIVHCQFLKKFFFLLFMNLSDVVKGKYKIYLWVFDSEKLVVMRLLTLQFAPLH